MGLWITLLLGVFVLIGAAITALVRRHDAVVEVSIAIAAGAILMLLVFDLLPEALGEVKELGIPLAIVALVVGVLLLGLLDRFLPDEHHSGHHPGQQDSMLHISIATAIVLIVHNVVEGMGVYSVSVQSVSLALLLGLGIGVHNIPMGMIVYSGISHERMGRRVLILALASLSTFVGGCIMAATSSAVDERVMTFMVWLTIGMLLYIEGFELIPHLRHSKRPALVVIGVVVGAAAVWAGGLLETLA